MKVDVHTNNLVKIWIGNNQKVVCSNPAQKSTIKNNLHLKSTLKKI